MTLGFAAVCPRPRNAAATRTAILEAASKRFAAESYEQVGMRDIARDVGVDPALISRYFGSKEELFRAVLDDCDGQELMDGDRSTFGERMADDLVYGPAKDEDLAWLLIMLKSAGSPKAAEIVQQLSVECFYQPFTEWLGGKDAPIRARVLAGILMGIAVGRDLSGGMKLSPEECERMKALLAPMLQELVDG
ncbi:MAG: TetR family transcriptional regulator [Brevundimonas sp. 12-68-7]|uniref:TetR family transcriptional regulator n=1 Tax=Brevundimonas subvibrioides TaxID=74313 RepID=A0A258FRH7_9CAUL|nr:MAG: TetR family transcriptional regulator [Brevundimonas sp. 12-68-7]OYX35200.1 MAG: TetR family transcriptional regulator [Brevundimonas subvibrioides]